MPALGHRQAVLIRVEVDVATSLPAFTTVGRVLPRWT
jgi:hypothetical protein